MTDAQRPLVLGFFFFNDTATTEIYTLSLHDALPIWLRSKTLPGSIFRFQIRSTSSGRKRRTGAGPPCRCTCEKKNSSPGIDRKSTRLNSSHANISYAVFCLKKKKDISLTLGEKPNSV